jgi:hypothetical protein
MEAILSEKEFYPTSSMQNLQATVLCSKRQNNRVLLDYMQKHSTQQPANLKQTKK